MKTMPLKLRHDDETPAPLRFGKPQAAEERPALQLAPEATAETQTKTSATPTFAKMGRALARPLRKRPKLTRKNAAILLGVSTLVGMRYIDANVEPNWPTYAPSYPKAMVGPNAASFYHAAIESFDMLIGPQYAQVSKTIPVLQKDQRVPWSSLNEKEAPLELKRAAMLDNADALKWLHEAGTKNYYGNFDGKWLKSHFVAPPTLSTPVPNFVAMRELARTAAGSCDVLAAEGKRAEAFDRALDVSKWGIDMTHDPTLIQGMIGLLIQGIGQQKATELLASLSPEEAKAALARMESLPPPASFAAMVQSEEAFTANTLQDIFRSGDMTTMGILAGRNAPTPLGAIGNRIAYDAFLMAYTKHGLVENYTGVMEEYVRLGAMPYYEVIGPMNAYQEKVNRGEGMNWFTRVAVPNFTRSRWAFEARVAGREILRTQLALKVYRASHGGRLPAELSELTSAGILAQISTDPFSMGAAEPLRYDAQTGKVWSVGADGIDQNGAGDDDLKPS